MAAGTIEKIQVILQAVTTKFAKGIDRANSRLKVVGKNMEQFGSAMQAPVENFKKMDGQLAGINTVGGKVAKRFRLMTHGMKGFRMEALGVMFFGMMLQRMFIGLLQPVMEVFGVFDLFRVMLLTLFLPIMEALFPTMLAIMGWFINLPEPVKKALGIFVLLGAILGLILMVIGQFALGIGSMIIMFPVFGAAIKLVGAFLVSFGVIAMAVIAVVVAVVIGMFIAWKENFMGMRKLVKIIFDAIKGIFKGAFDVIMGIVQFFVAVFKGDFEGAKKAVIRIMNGLKSFFLNLVVAILGIIAAIGVGVVRIFVGVVKTIKDALLSLISWFINKISSFAGGVVSKISGVFGRSKKVNDFILQPGGRLIETNPNDTIVGSKSGFPGSGGETNITNNFNGFTRDDLNRDLDDRDRRLVEDVRRLVKE